MRLAATVLSVIFVAVPLAAAAPKQKIAVAPLEGDDDNKVGDAVAEALAGKDFAVIGPNDTRAGMTKVGVAELDRKGTRKLASWLGVIAVVDGTVGKARGKRTLHLEVHRRGKPSAGFTVEFKSTAAAAFRRGVHDEVKKKLERAEQDSDDDDDDKPRPVARHDEDRKPADEPRRAASDDGGSRRSPPREVASRRRDDDDAPAVRKRKSRRASDDDAAPMLLARVGAGASVAQRQLSYDTRSGFMQVPPRVQTYAGAGRVDGELYPFALAGSSGALAALGLAGSYDKTFGLSIKIPNQSVRAPIDQSHWSLGARYRFAVGEASNVALGVDYVRRHYIADRSALMALILDAPDVDYAAIAPTAAARIPVTRAVAIIACADGLLMLAAGPIGNTASYGPATVYGIEATGGVDIAISPRLGLRVAAELSQISFSFGNKGQMAVGRDNDPTTQDVNGATDRSIGVAATLGLVY